MKALIGISATATAMFTAGPAWADPTDCGNQRPIITRLLADYRAAIEGLDARGTERMFSANSAVFENGGVEGTYANYLARHLGPELGHFRSFRFTDHQLEMWCDGAVAVATETYNYRIERNEGEPIARRGVTTSVLRRTGRNWQIVNMHGSSRAPRPSS